MKSFVDSSKFVKKTFSFVNSYLFVEQGSALIITLLVIMVISAVGIGIGRLTLSEIKQTVNLENSVGAEAIAESGIEHGLLLYRFNHNAEVCEGKTTETSCDAKSKPLTINMGSGAYYDILMYHKLDPGQPEIVNSNGETPALGKDQTVEYDLTKIDQDGNPGTLDGTLRLKWAYKPIDPSLPIPEQQKLKDQMRLEYMAIKADGTKVDDRNWLFVHDDSLDSNGKILNITGAVTLRIKSMGGDLKDYTLTDGDAAEQLGSRYTYVESTGYFGNTKRKVQVKLDRHSGQILGTYDFVLYSGVDGINQ